MRSVRRQWSWLLTPLLAAQLLSTAGADGIASYRNFNLSLVETFCVTIDIPWEFSVDGRSVVEQVALEQAIGDRFSDDAMLYDLPLIDSCYGEGYPDATVHFKALILDKGLRYDLVVLFHGADGLFDPTIYSNGGIAISNRDINHEELTQELLEATSGLFRDFVLDWKQAP